MARYCFLLQVRPELLDEYVERHRAVWPEMLQALHDSGWRNYSIFSRPDGMLVGYVEADSLDDAQAAMARTAVNARWQAEMGRYFTTLPGGGDTAEALAGNGSSAAFHLLTEVFHLEDQLEATR